MSRNVTVRGTVVAELNRTKADIQYHPLFYSSTLSVQTTCQWVLPLIVAVSLCSETLVWFLLHCLAKRIALNSAVAEKLRLQKNNNSYRTLFFPLVLLFPYQWELTHNLFMEMTKDKLTPSGYDLLLSIVFFFFNFPPNWIVYRKREERRIMMRVKLILTW